jgi:hypothetical protein
MRFRGLSRTFLTRVGLGLFLLTAITATARDGRDFAGIYSLTNVQQSGDTVHLTLHLRLSNNSDADIKGAIVTLMQDSPLVALRGSFPTVQLWRKNQAVKLSGQFTISKREYEDWSRAPGQPNIVILYQDASGRTWQKGAQMHPRPTI